MAQPKKTRKGDLHPKRIENPDATCPRHPKKEWRPLVQKAWDAGWWCEKRRKYIFWYPIDQRADIVKVPMTPSDWRTMRNTERDFKAAGLEM